MAAAGEQTPRCMQRALVRYATPTGKWLYLCGVHLGEFLSESRPSTLAATMEKLDVPPKKHLCERPARGRDAVWGMKLAKLGEPDPTPSQARDLAGAASELAQTLKVRETGTEPSAAVVVAFGDVAARVAILGATLGLDFDTACLNHARGLAGGTPAGAEGEAGDDGSGEEETV